MNDVKSKTLPEEKLREIAEALLFLASARAVMEKQIQDRAPPSLFLFVRRKSLDATSKDEPMRMSI